MHQCLPSHCVYHLSHCVYHLSNASKLVCSRSSFTSVRFLRRPRTFERPVDIPCFPLSLTVWSASNREESGPGLGFISPHKSKYSKMKVATELLL